MYYSAILKRKLLIKSNKNKNVAFTYFVLDNIILYSQYQQKIAESHYNIVAKSTFYFITSIL